MSKTILTTTIVKNDNFDTVGLEMRTDHIVYSYGVSSCSPFCYTKTIHNEYYEQFYELLQINSEISLIKDFERRFFDIAANTLGWKAIEGKSFQFDKEHANIEKLEARRCEIINSIK